MTALLKTVAVFLGEILSAIAAKLLPAIGREIRRNHTVEQKGNDNETTAALNADIRNAAGNDAHQPGLRDVPPNDHAPS